MTTPVQQIGTTAAPTPAAAVKQDEWWKNPSGIMGTPTTYNATTGTAAGYDPTKWNVDGKQTVQGQINDILNSGSPLMQKAETRANQQMNARGIMNSSMAVGAGQSALYDAALPIAQADASVNANAANFNAGAANTANQFNATAENQQTLANQESTNRASEFGASASNELQKQGNLIQQQAAQQDQDAANKLAMQDLDNQFKASLANADFQTKAYLTQAEGEIKQQLASVEADYKTLIQTSASASDTYKGTLAAITQIIADPNMDATSKTTAINGLFNRMGVAMNLIGSINGVDLTDLLNFGEVTATP